MVPARPKDLAQELRVQSPKDYQTYTWLSNMGRGKLENLKDRDQPDDGGTSRTAGPT
ncbi:MAG: hypothetical protein GY696_19925 [Gammaproteobacteria bacterium]|nr:hypothetical protein [Gammaproteobacteria bacterium]